MNWNKHQVIQGILLDFHLNVSVALKFAPFAGTAYLDYIISLVLYSSGCKRVFIV